MASFVEAVSFECAAELLDVTVHGTNNQDEKGYDREAGRQTD